MITVNNITVRFGSFELLNSISFMINPRDRIGLVGKNGAGKSTLLKIFMEIEKPETGDVVMPSDITMGYLPQHLSPIDGKTVLNEAKSAFEEVLDLENQIGEINNELSKRTDYESDSYMKLINGLSELNDRYSLLGGATVDSDIEKTLLGLGFTHSDFNRQTAEFSGGWRMRIELAKILLKKPNIFLLDEPTNHLDIESIQWLEDFLKNYPGAVILISHDRAFLDNITNRTVELSLGKLYDYKVPYSKYEILREERHEQELAAYANQQKMIESTEKFIERFRYKATKAVQVQSRIKQLEKLERVKVEEEDNSAIRFKFPPAPRSGDIVVQTKNMTKSYGNHIVLENIDLILERGEKVAFVGRNGEGKTTLSKIIMSELSFDGTVKIGHNVEIGYFAQNQDELMDENKTVFEIIDEAAVGNVRTQVRSILGSFLFSGETIDKKVTVLSGGERSRLALAKLLLQPYSLLVLDEPTNHLDMRSKDILKQALLQYDGTLLIVSHDRDFLDGLVDKIFEFGNREIKEHLGGIYDFLCRKKIESLTEIEREEKEKKQVKSGKSADNKVTYLERKEFDKKLRVIKNKVKKSEQCIEELESEIEKLESLFSTNADIEHSTYEKHNELKENLAKEMEQWERFCLEYDEFEKQRP